MADPIPTAGTPPTTELGTITGRQYISLDMNGVSAQRWIENEHVPELQHPSCYRVYDEMITDPQVGMVLLGVKLPLRRYVMRLDPNGADEAAVQAFSQDIGVPIVGSDSVERAPEASKITPDHLIDMGMLGLRYGNMWTEIVGYNEDTPRGWFRLHKLAPRLPRSIRKFDLARDGNPTDVIQGGGVQPIVLQITRMLGWIWDQDPGNYFGRALIRSAHKPWWYKQQLGKVDAVKHRRNGMGVPVGELPPGADPATLKTMQAAMSALQAGDGAGVAVPSGGKITMQGVQGSMPDTLASIRYWDEQVSKAGLMMVANLGQTETGSRALGDTFADMFTQGVDSISDFVVKPINDFLIPRWFTWNIGADAPRPKLVLERVEDPQFVIRDIGMAVDEGIITPGPELASVIERAWRMPKGTLLPGPMTTGEAGPGTATNPNAPKPTAEPRGPESVDIAASRGWFARRAWRKLIGKRPVAATAMLPDRPLRRAPTPQEMQASTDFKALDDAWQSATDKLVADWQSIRSKQIDDLGRQIVNAAGQLLTVSTVKATPEGADVLRAALMDAAAAAASEMQSEAKRQGTTLPAVSTDAYEADITARANATASVLADYLSNAATSNAIRFIGGSLTADDVASKVTDQLNSLSDSWLHDRLGGALSSAQNAGRFAAADQAAGLTPTRYYASELLDANTCPACEAIDDTEFDSADDAAAAYPTGGYIDCEGGDRCRGTIVVVYGEADATLQGGDS